MELKKVREMNAQELAAEKAGLAERLFRVRFAKGLGKQEGVGQIRGLKRDIARLNTVAREQQLAAQKAGK